MSDTQTFKKSNTSQGTAWQRLVFWKMGIAKLVCLCLMAGVSSITATLNGVEWGSFTSTQKFLAIAALVSAVTSNVLAFLSETMSKLSAQAEAERKSEVANPSP